MCLFVITFYSFNVNIFLMILIERFVKFSYLLLLCCAFEYFIEKAQYNNKCYCYCVVINFVCIFL